MKHQLLGRQGYPYVAMMPAVEQQDTELVVNLMVTYYLTKLLSSSPGPKKIA